MSRFRIAHHVGIERDSSKKKFKSVLPLLDPADRIRNPFLVHLGREAANEQEQAGRELVE